MTLDVGKVVYGAFAVPWLQRKYFARALAAPLVLLVGVIFFWQYVAPELPPRFAWPMQILHVAVFVLFAVTCHRLVLLEPHDVASQRVLRWGWRETNFLICLVVVGGISIAILVVLATVAFTLTTPAPDEFTRWWLVIAKIPGYYVFARLCLLLPSAALDRRHNLRWSWTKTRRNGWRLTVVVGVLPFIISQLLDFISRRDASPLETIVVAVVGCLLLAVEISALSLSYRELTKGDATAVPLGTI